MDSQLLHGEQAAMQICGQLTNACNKMDEKWYAASQVVDEARHAAFGVLMIRRILEDAEPLSARAIRDADSPLRESRALENSEQHYSRAATGFLQKRSN
jgi:hypothetical protein